MFRSREAHAILQFSDNLNVRRGVLLQKMEKLCFVLQDTIFNFYVVPYKTVLTR